MVSMVSCDYCEKQSVCKVTVHNKSWYLCLDHAKENKDRLMIKQKDLDKLEKEIQKKEK